MIASLYTGVSLVSFLRASVDIKKPKSYFSLISLSLLVVLSCSIDVTGLILFFSKYSHNSNALIKLGSFNITLVFLIGLRTGLLSFRPLINVEERKAPMTSLICSIRSSRVCPSLLYSTSSSKLLSKLIFILYEDVLSFFTPS